MSNAQPPDPDRAGEHLGTPRIGLSGPIPAPGEDTSVALALVNTLLHRPNGAWDLLDDPDDLAPWLLAHGLASDPPPAQRPDLDRLVELRGAIRELFLAVADTRTPTPAAVTAVNEAAAAVPGAPQLDWPASGPRRRWLSSGRAELDIARAAVAADAIEVVSGPRAAMLRRCEAHGCVRVFLREHARRQWCCTTCGDRVRAARHYQRTQPGSRRS